MDNNIIQVNQQTLSIIEKIHVDEFNIFLSQIGLIDNDFQREFLNNLLNESGKDDNTRAIIQACRGKMYSIEGNLKKARFYLIDAEEIAFKNYIANRKKYNDSYAYVIYESATFDLKIDEQKTAEKKLLLIKELTDNKLILQLTNYQLERLRIDDRLLYDPKYHQDLVEIFYANNSYIMYILGMQHLGIYYQKNRDFNSALLTLEKGLSFAKEQEYKYLISSLELTMAYTNYLHGKLERSIELYNYSIETSVSHYLRSKALEGLAIIYFKQEEYRKAEDNILKAYYNSVEHDVFLQITAECNFIGDLYWSKFQDFDKARHYYKLGYEESISQIKSGLSMNFDRLSALKKYPELLSSRISEPKQKKEHKSTFFEQFKGMRWAGIRDQFQYNLIIYHRLKTHKFEKFLKDMGLIKATYYSNHLKLKSKGFEFPDLRRHIKEIPSENYNQSIQDYISQLDDKTWFPANKHFDQNLMSYLYKVNRYQKTALAKSLQISYQAVRNRTMHLSRSAD